jgi:hypothetical protein
MPNKSEAKPRRRGRPNLLKNPTTTTINIEGSLLQRVTKTAYALGQSVSKWVSIAAEEKLTREAK